MWNLVANQSIIDEMTERSNYLIKERVGKIPGNYQVISIIHLYYVIVKNCYTNNLESKRSYRK